MSIESLDTSKDFSVVAARNEDLGARSYRSLQNGERPGGELVLLDLSDLVFTVVNGVNSQ